MTPIQVGPGKTMLEGLTKTPPVGLCELVWNAFDADAEHVTIEVDRNPLGGVEVVRVIDDGEGMSAHEAKRAFSTVGDSWKIMPGTQTSSGRIVHGRHGRGRYAAFSLGSVVSWESTSRELDGGDLRTIRVRGDRSHLDRFEIEDVEPRSETGTSVIVSGLTPEASKAFDEIYALRHRLLSEFALHLDRHPDFKIDFLGALLVPSDVIEFRKTIKLSPIEGVSGDASLTVIEWDLQDVERRLYLCNSGGAIISEMPPKIQAVGAEFTAYVHWDGFSHDQALILEGDEDTPAGKVVAKAREKLRAYLAASGRRREAATINRWRSEGVYPSLDDLDPAARDTFNVVAMAASRVVDESKTLQSKALALSLLKETFASDPERLLPILRQVAKLPSSRIDELREILEHTTLAQLISLGREVGDRVEFINGLNALIFDKMTKKRMLERRQLHRILAHQTWIFGEEWSITGDDDRLTTVLANHLSQLGEDIDFAGAPPVLREDGSDGIPDLVLGRKLETHENRFHTLVVELKRPSHTLTDDDISQLRSYASAITNDERFDQPNSTWEFWLVGNDARQSVNEQRDSVSLPYGVVQRGKKYSIVVRTWAEIIGDAEHRLKFVQRSLKFESNRDSGLAAMRERYAEYLPSVALEGLSKTTDGGESQLSVDGSDVA